jgi:hypothetical protein
MNENNNTKFIMVPLTLVVIIMISVTIASNSFTVIPAVLAHNREDKIGGGVSQQECSRLLDKVKGLDEKDISRLLADDNSGQKLQDLRVSLMMCGASSNLDNALKPKDLQRLDPAVIAILGQDTIQNLIR